MELDFSKLDSLYINNNINNKILPRTATETILEGVEYNLSICQENALKQPTDDFKALQHEADENRADRERWRSVYRAYQENIRRSGQIQTELIKGVQAGDNIYSLFLKAIEAISCMTSNDVIYTQIKNDLENVYGQALTSTPLDTDIAETKERLDKLIKAEQTEIDSKNKERLKRDITAHKDKLLKLNNIK